MTAAPFPDRDAVADRLASFAEADQSFLKLLLENPVQDDNLLEGLRLWLDKSAEAKFLNSLKLERIGEWIGANAPARLQIRLNEVGKSSQHPAFHAFRDGLDKSGGMEKAFPKA
ncbi:hypothetical protein [Rhizobium sp. LjRoot254]|uniref:hypothetical protein n=1 Tax=Rhizobium sp. LjRoot254 TaxID=3342297 RepID=UPI003ECCD29B